MDEALRRFKSSRFGEIEIPEASIITFVGGLVGFADCKSFTLISYKAPFSWLQSLENPDLAFVVVNAAEFGDEYQFDLPFGDYELALEGGDEVAIMNLVSIRPDPSQTTVNLKAPIVVNMKNRRARQIILDDPRYPVRLQLWSEAHISKAREQGK